MRLWDSANSVGKIVEAVRVSVGNHTPALYLEVFGHGRRQGEERGPKDRRKDKEGREGERRKRKK